MMRRAFGYSILIHCLMVAGLVYSAKLALVLFKARQLQMKNLGVIQVDLTYKATDTAMKYGVEKKDLPPPMIEPKKEEIAEDAPKEKEVKTKAVDKGNDKKKPNIKSILDEMRKEAKKEDRPPPKEKNFPVNEKGEQGAHGTGGRAERALSPAEQALQAAMRRYFELPDADTFRKNFPNAVGYMDLSLVGLGGQFHLNSIHLTQTTGFAILDQQCEMAIRRALDTERFSADVVQDLNGKEIRLTCQP